MYEDASCATSADIYAPDMVAEVAERFMYLEGMRWSLGFGEYEDALYFSIRTSDRRMNAGRLIREVIEAKGGSAGGHGTMAGARIPVKGLSAAALQAAPRGRRARLPRRLRREGAAPAKARLTGTPGRR